MSKTIEFIEEKIKMLNVTIESTVKIIKEFDGIAPAASYKKLVEEHLKEIGTFQQIKEELEAWEVVKPNIVEEDNIIDREYIDFIKEKESKREDKDNIYCTGITDKEFVNFIIEYLLGEDWYVADSLGHNQVNQIALEEILDKYSKKFRKELSDYKRGDK